MPDEQMAPQPQEGPKKQKSFVGIVVIIIIAALIVGGYFWWSSSETNENTNTTITTNTNTSSDIDTLFQDAVNQNNWTLTEDYFAETVTFIKEATECCGDITAAEAAAEMEYMDGITFNFSQDQQIVQTIKSNLGDQGFADETIGIADTKQVISYHVDDENKVDRVYMSASHELMDLE
jgi:flagellar basal body-associated protein FliL